MAPITDRVEPHPVSPFLKHLVTIYWVSIYPFHISTESASQTSVAVILSESSHISFLVSAFVPLESMRLHIPLPTKRMPTAFTAKATFRPKIPTAELDPMGFNPDDISIGEILTLT